MEITENGNDRPGGPALVLTWRRALLWWGAALLLLVLGAHFYRASAWGLVFFCVGMLGLHCGRAPWKGFALSYFLGWGALEWSASAVLLVNARLLAGMPWLRAGLILWCVALLTGLAAIALYRQSRGDARHQPEARSQGALFMVIFCAVYYLEKVSPLPLLLLERFMPGWGAAEIFFLAWYGVFAQNLLSDAKRRIKGRKRLWLLFSAVFFSQLALGLLGAEKFLMTGTLHVPVPGFIIFGAAFRGALTVMLPLLLASVMLTGSAWCSMLCYFGPLDQCAGAGKAIKPLPAGPQRLLRLGRPALLVLGLAAALALGFFVDMALAQLAAVAFVAASFLVMLLLSRRYGGMMHCTAFCPVGFVVDALGRFSPWRLVVDQTRCDNCGACEKVCRYRAISRETRARGKTEFGCSLCLDCLAVCRRQAIAMHAPFLDPERARKVFTSILVTLHVVFLAFARV